MNNIDAPGSHKSVFRRHGVKLLLILVLLGILIGLGVTLTVLTVTQPAEGTIVKTARPAEITTTLKTLKTPYYATSYPSTYELQPRPANSASLDAQVLVARSESRFGAASRITLTIESLPEGGVTESSAYHFLESQPDVNILTNDQYGGEDIIMATRVTPDFEKTVLWPHGSYLLTMTLLASSETSTVNTDLQTILNNIRW